MTEAEKIRMAAEARLLDAPLGPVDLSPDGIQRTLHELRVHQIELEMQNEELRRTHVELEAARSLYFDLYEMAPVGYVTIHESGTIIEANLTAAHLLDVKRANLLHRPLSNFISQEYQDVLYLHLNQFRKAGAADPSLVHQRDVFDVRMVKPDRTYFWACLECSATIGIDARPAYRIVISDISVRKQTEAIQNFLANTSNGTQTEPFFSTLAHYLAQSLEMDVVHIDCIEGLNARTLAVWCDGKLADNMTYALRDTPCGELVGKDLCRFPAHVCQYFPRNQMLKDVRAESYIGVTLRSHTGKAIGLIALISRNMLVNQTQAETTLKRVAERAAAELERLQADEALRHKMEELRISNDELELFNRVMVGRELRMIELKQEINDLCRRLGEPLRHATTPPLR